MSLGSRHTQDEGEHAAAGAAGSHPAPAAPRAPPAPSPRPAAPERMTCVVVLPVLGLLQLVPVGYTLFHGRVNIRLSERCQFATSTHRRVHCVVRLSSWTESQLASTRCTLFFSRTLSAQRNVVLTTSTRRTVLRRGAPVSSGGPDRSVQYLFVFRCSVSAGRLAQATQSSDTFEEKTQDDASDGDSGFDINALAEAADGGARSDLTLSSRSWRVAFLRSTSRRCRFLWPLSGPLSVARVSSGHAVGATLSVPLCRPRRASRLLRQRPR